MQMRSLTLLIAAVILPGTNSFAQKNIDTSKVIQVRLEPRHRDVVDNEWVRILDVHIPPGDTSLFHKHSTPSIFLVLSNTKTGSQALIEPRKRTFSKENIWFEDFTDTPRIHRVWNEDTVPFHTIDIELPHKPSGNFNPDSKFDFGQLLFDEKLVRAYRVTIPPNQGFKSIATPYPLVVVGLSGPDAKGAVNGKTFTKKGDYLFVPAGDGPFGMNNDSKDGNMVFAVFVLK